MYAMRHAVSILFAFVLCFVASITAYSQAPGLVSFQLQLDDDGSLPETVDIEVRLYDAATGGSLIWSEDHSASHHAGAVGLLLGGVSPFPVSAFRTDGDRYLDILIDGESVGDRFRVASVPFAQRATEADRAGLSGLQFVDGSQQTSAAFVGNGLQVSASRLLEGTNTRVGFGTSNPQARVHILGDGTTDNARLKIETTGGQGSPLLHLSHTGPGGKDWLIGSAGTGFEQSGIALGSMIFTDALEGDTPIVISPDHNVGINNVTPTTTLDVGGTVKATSFVGDGSGLTNLPAVNDGLWLQGGAPNQIFTSFDKVGINISNPNYTLHVNGNTAMLGAIHLGANGAGDGEWIDNTRDFVSEVGQSGIGFFGDYGEKMRMDGMTGNLGIRTSTPAERLSIAGAAEGIELGANVLGKNQAAGTIMYARYSDALDIVGVGTTANNRKVKIWAESGLEVTGAIVAAGTITQGSSREYKKDIENLSLEEAYSAFRELSPVKFRYINDASGDLHLGFIAEDVPDLMSVPNRKGLDSGDFVALLTRVVQEQEERILALEALLLERQ